MKSKQFRRPFDVRAMQQLASKEFLWNRQDDSQEIRHKKLMKTTQEKATSNRFESIALVICHRTQILLLNQKF